MIWRNSFQMCPYRSIPNVLKSILYPALTVWDRQCLEDSQRKDHSLSQLMTKVCIEQPRLHWVC